MNLQGPLVKQITAEILHSCKKSLQNLYMDNLWVIKFFIASLKAFKDFFCFTSSGTRT